MEEKEIISQKYLGKGKTGKYCGFREKHFCNKNCGMYMESLGSCCLHGINWNMKKILDELKKITKVEIGKS